MIGKAVAKQQTLCLTATVFLAGIAGFAILLLSGSAAAQTIGDTWRGLSVASEHRCTPYVRRDYPYPQSVEADIVASTGGRIYGPYTGRYFASTRQTDIEHIVAFPKRMTAAYALPTAQPAGASPPTRST